MQLSFRKVLARFNICTVLAILKLTLTDNFLNDIRVTGFPSKMRWISYPTHPKFGVNTLTFLETPSPRY